MKITYDSWYDRHGNRYVRMEEGNIAINLQMQQCKHITCYIRIRVSREERVEIVGYYFKTIKEANKFIKKTYETYKHLYNLEKK